VTLLDANILLYAYNSDAPQYKASAAWLSSLLEGTDLVGLPWPTLWAFLRISTSPRIWSNPKPMDEALRIVRDLITQPGVVLVQPGPRHLEILEATVNCVGVTSKHLTDAVLAALAIENGAILASTDNDFSRFENLRWVNPLR
jgi:uncharacterized protein